MAYVPYDGYIAELHKGERVLTAEEAQIVAIAPQLMMAFAEIRSNNAHMAESSGGRDEIQVSLGGITIHVDAEVAANPDTLRETLFSIGEDLADFIIDTVEEHQRDTDRRAYK